MTMAGDVTAARNGRASKFTPERMIQITNLVERGHSREEIAEIIGVTLGTLQVTCSKMGVSLRRPRYDNGVRCLSKRAPMSDKPDAPNVIQLKPPTVPAAITATVTLSLQVQHRDRLREFPLAITEDMVAKIAAEAWLRDMKMDDLITQVLIEIVKGDLFHLVSK